jgi:hypothetical protein
MTRWAMYANTPLDSSIKQKLYPTLAEAMDGKSYPEAADILLDFVQSAFVYEFDDNFNVTDHYYLGMSDDELKARMAAVANQGAVK